MLPIIAVYHAFGLSEVSSMELVTMGVLLYIGASYTPLPGASGRAGGRLRVLFKGIFPGCAAVCRFAHLADSLLII